MPAQNDQGKDVYRCCSGCLDWVQPPLGRQQAAEVLGVSIGTLFKIRKQYGENYEIEACHRGNIVFYQNHIENIKELLKWENRKMTEKATYPAGTRFGKITPFAMTSTSRAKGSGGRRASAIQARLK